MSDTEFGDVIQAGELFADYDRPWAAGYTDHIWLKEL